MAKRYLLTKSEAELAFYQKLQIGNSCSFHAITTAVKMLLAVEIDPQELSDEVDHLWWRFKPMRTFPGWAVTPTNQKQIVKYLAESRNLPIKATFSHANVETLREVIGYANAVPIITLLWVWGQAPGIYLGNASINHNTSSAANGHTMVMAAYDPEHFNYGVGSTPWGLINSWVNNSQQLFWMTDEAFQRTWNFFLPFVGPNPLVSVERKE